MKFKSLSVFNLILLVFVGLTFFSCKTKSALVEPAVEEIVEEKELEPVIITESAVEPEEEIVYELPRYNPSSQQQIDILHTKLDLSFDWTNQYVLGKADITLKPYFYPTNEIALDAVGFDIKKVSFSDSDAGLEYQYDGQTLTISLNRIYNRNEEIKIHIDYIAKPNENPEGGSAAITSDKGLFFINPLGTSKEKPMQIWTQGETENNSRWFPTVDKPNERCTQEIYLTVDDKFETLSNGALISSTKNEDGTRTDYWKMDLPHAPYLFMIAIGEFAVVKDQWRGREVSYYVDPEYKDHARGIFDHTPEMLDFFSELTGVEYPWPKMGQVAVKDYVSGAMENTTGIIYGDFVQKTTRELIDNNNDMIVAHEIFHHWFGDMVTCESWANLTLNEGFANYGEYLWHEYKNGVDNADYHRSNEMRGYLGSAQNGIHPLIHFGYEDKELMFDAHSYNKGGLVLHMLRNYLGDDAFFSGFKKYLTDNAYSAVEADELRMAFEDVSGEDLNWFFDQWFFSAGHPILKITYGYDEASKEATMNVVQIQDPEENPAIFQIPVIVDLFTDNDQVFQYNIWVDQREQEFRFPSDNAPKLINFDSPNSLLCEKSENLSEEQYAFQFFNAPAFQDRYDAIRAISSTGKGKEVYESALNDPFYVIRAIGIRDAENNDPAYYQQVKKMAVEDPHSQVRSVAVNKLSKAGDQIDLAYVKSIIKNDQAFPVVAAGLKLLNQLDPAEAIKEADNLSGIKNGSLFSAVAAIYANSDNPQYVSFFDNNLSEVSLFQTFGFYDQYFNYLKGQKVSDMLSASGKFKALATDMSVETFRRFVATMTINKIKKHVEELSKDAADGDKQAKLMKNLLELEATINEIKEMETNPNLLSRYQSF